MKKKKGFFPFTTFDDANNTWLQAKLEWVVSKNCNSLPGCANSWILFKYFKGFRSPFQAKCQSVQIETNAKQDSPISPKWNKINSKTALFLVFWRKKYPKRTINIISYSFSIVMTMCCAPHMVICLVIQKFCLRELFNTCNKWHLIKGNAWKRV